MPIADSFVVAFTIWVTQSGTGVLASVHVTLVRICSCFGSPFYGSFRSIKDVHVCTVALSKMRRRFSHFVYEHQSISWYDVVLENPCEIDRIQICSTQSCFLSLVGPAGAFTGPVFDTTTPPL